MEDYIELDELSHDILFILLLNKKKRFNDLFRTLRGKRKLSKPTLSISLKNLVEKNLIIREVEDVQKVTYRLNEEKFFLSNKYKEELDNIIKYYISENILNKIDTIDAELDFILKNITITKLYELKLKIIFDVLPIKVDFKELPYTNILFSKQYEKQLLKRCNENNTIKNRVLEKINELIKTLEASLND